jgi:two-component system, OmpR family, sensor histidine kinase BaeS
MRGWQRSRLHSRLFVSYLVVIAVASITLYLTSLALTPTLFSWHLGHFGLGPGQLHGMMPDVEVELAAAHTVAMRQAVLWGALASLLVAGSLSLFVAGRITLPLRAIQRASRRISAGAYRERLEVSAIAEIGELADAFNGMAAALEDTERCRQELMANLAHELATPLSSLTGYLEGLQDGHFQPSAETFAACLRQTKRLEHLVHDLGLLSRVEAGVETVETRDCDAGALLEQAAAGWLPQFRSKGVRLELNPPSERVTVRADPQRTSQVLANLLANALRHTPPGGTVRLAARAGRHAAEATFEVVDDGEGIPAEALPHVFTRFYRADRSRRRDAGTGSGIGLTVAKGFVDAQGGRIGVESEPGSGSRFWFTLPLAGQAE